MALSLGFSFIVFLIDLAMAHAVMGKGKVIYGHLVPPIEVGKEVGAAFLWVELRETFALML